MTHPPLYLMRHGETEWNRAGRIQGRLDSPLTPLGRAQAACLGRALGRHVGPETAMLASPLGRAWHTATIVAQGLGVATDRVVRDERLREISWGRWDGMTRADIEQRTPGELARRIADRWSHVPPDGESYAMAAVRIGALLSALRAQARPAVLVAHGAINRLIRGLYGGVEPGDLVHLDERQDTYHRLAAGRIEAFAVPVDPP